MGPMKEHATVDCLSEHEHAVELNSKYYFYTQRVVLASSWYREVHLCRGLLVSNIQQYIPLLAKNACQVAYVYCTSQSWLKVINIDCDGWTKSRHQGRKRKGLRRQKKKATQDTGVCSV